MKPWPVLAVVALSWGCASQPQANPFPYRDPLIERAAAAERRSEWWLVGIGSVLAAGAVVLLSAETGETPVVPLAGPPPDDDDPGPCRGKACRGGGRGG